MKLLILISLALVSFNANAGFTVTCKNLTDEWSEHVEKKNPLIAFGYDWVKIEKDNSIHIKIKKPENHSELLRERTCQVGHWEIVKD